MTLAQKFIQEFNELPEEKKQEVIDFVEFLKQKEDNLESMMDDIIAENHEALEELGR